MKKRHLALLLGLAVCAAPQAMACYTVYNPANQIVYSGVSTPVDMSYQIHEKLPLAFPSGHMVFNNNQDCQSVDLRKTAPVLTNVAGGRLPESPIRYVNPAQRKSSK